MPSLPRSVGFFPRGSDDRRSIVTPSVVLQPQPKVELLGPFEVPTIPNNRTPFAQLQAEYRQTVSDNLAELDARTRTREGRIQTIANVWNPNQSNTPWNNNSSSGRLFNDVVSDSFARRGGVVFQNSSISTDDGIYYRSRNQLDDFQVAEARKKHAEDQYKQQHRMQAEQRELLAQAMAMVPRQQPRKPNVKSRLQQQFEREVPFTSKADWLQFAHEKRLEYYQILRAYGQQAADQFEQAIQDQAVQNIIGPNALRHKDGYIIVGNQAVGTAEAEQKAREFVEHVVEHEEYPPLQYHTNPNLPKSAYPDVAKLMDKHLNNLTKNVMHHYFASGRAGVYINFYESFPNNQEYDFQVNHGLPGQVVSDDSIKLDENGNVITVDQYAVYQGKVVRAGYLSNYAYGYGGASGGLRLDILKTIPQVKGDKQDNPEDLKAIEDGFYAFKRQYPEEAEARFFSDYF